MGATPRGRLKSEGGVWLALAGLIAAPLLILWSVTSIVSLVHRDGITGFNAITQRLYPNAVETSDAGPGIAGTQRTADRATFRRDYWERLLGSMSALLAGLLCLALLRRRALGSDRSHPSSVPGQDDLYQRPPGCLEDPGLFFFIDVFDRTPIALVLLDGNGRVVRLNQAAELLTEFTTEAVRGSFYWDVFLEGADREQASSHFRAPEDSGPIPEAWVSRSGARRKMLWSRVLFHSQPGRLTHVLMAVAPSGPRQQNTLNSNSGRTAVAITPPSSAPMPDPAISKTAAQSSVDQARSILSEVREDLFAAKANRP